MFNSHSINKERNQMKSYIIATLILALTSACASTSTKKYDTDDMEGTCVHPAVNGGQPFPLSKGTHLVGDRLYSPNNKGFLTGQVCLFTFPQAGEDKQPE
jgi:hypothetical protein